MFRGHLQKRPVHTIFIYYSLFYGTDVRVFERSKTIKRLNNTCDALMY